MSAARPSPADAPERHENQTAGHEDDQLGDWLHPDDVHTLEDVEIAHGLAEGQIRTLGEASGDARAGPELEGRGRKGRSGRTRHQRADV